MDLEPTGEQRELRTTVRRFLAEQAPIAVAVRPIAEGRAWSPDATWQGLASLGATGLLVGEADGGLGLGMVEAAMVAEELGRGLCCAPWASTAVAATRALQAVDGMPAAARVLCGDIAAGTITATVALARPADVHGPGVEPVRARDDAASGACLTGAVPQALSAPDADLVLVPAVGADGLAIFALDAEAAAGSIVALPSLDRTQSIGDLRLDDVSATRIGAITEADVDRVRDDLLVALGADALGAAQALLEIAVDYAKDRHQFGVPIGSFQAVQHLCVDMLETVELARGGVLHAAWAADAAPDERHLAALRVKAYADRLLAVADTAIQVLGGIGFTWEHDAHLYLKRLMTWSTFLGPAPGYRVALGRARAAG